MKNIQDYLEKQAQDYARSSYARPPKQSEDEADYIQAVAYYSFIAGYKAKESEIQQQPEPIEDIVQDFKELNIYLNDIYYEHLQGVKDAGHLWIEFTDKFNAFEKRVKAALQQGNNLPEQQGWISVEHKVMLPELGEYVFVTVGEDTVLKGRRMANGWTAFFSDGEILCSEDRPVTYHMTLPEPPKKNL